jgi:hypothetical protein
MKEFLAQRTSAQHSTARLLGFQGWRYSCSCCRAATNGRQATSSTFRRIATQFLLFQSAAEIAHDINQQKRFGQSAFL